MFYHSITLHTHPVIYEICIGYVVVAVVAVVGVFVYRDGNFVLRYDIVS